ncbi:hypothetical protein IM792_09265 [Mucilaginibacter sp. JRF]|uniref:hypothetical protein n=1 Tax=Mucilaginibacter sp. JRF TaxID=2780088 RepID=UPI00187F1580|nr:hypothetical protein [Mucilaginibacter sp. JRF]MBE9584633.1 hypothetical protein [Mucilaginibacter sp. JRF]
MEPEPVNDFSFVNLKERLTNQQPKQTGTKSLSIQEPWITEIKKITNSMRHLKPIAVVNIFIQQIIIRLQIKYLFVHLLRLDLGK